MTEPEFSELLPLILLPGEKLVWSEQPHPHVYVFRAVHSIFYGITWVVLGLFWFYGAGGVGHDSAFVGWWRLTPVFSLPFVFAGLSFFIHPVNLYLQAEKTWYVITDQRAFILEIAERKLSRQRVFQPEEVGRLLLTSRWDYLQDLIFTRRAQELPHLPPGLDAGFFGIKTGPSALEHLRQLELEKV